MRERRLTAGAQHASIRALFLMWLVCAPLAWFAVQLVEEVPVRQARIVAAAFGWHGEKGTVTIGESRRVLEGGGRGGANERTHCFGTFTPADGTAPLAGIRVHVDDCEPGRTVQARLIRKDPGSWVDLNKKDQAYAGAGWGEPLLLVVFMGLFLLLAGGPFVLFAVIFPAMMLLALHRRWRPAG